LFVCLFVCIMLQRVRLDRDPVVCLCSMLQGLVDFDGYYLESDPCLVCNNPEVPYTVSVPVFPIFPPVCRSTMPSDGTTKL